ncbi:MAG: hypothetical protein WC455_13595 [Dehalococcoidia bacterium]|jgi:hypothetical protein
MPVHDNVKGRTIAAAAWANGKLTLRCAINTTEAVTSAEAFLIDPGEEGWVASVLALTTGAKKRYLGVSEKAIAASTAALVTITDLVVGGVTDIITTALPTTGYFVTITTGAAIVNTASVGSDIGVAGVWRVTSTSLTAAKECILYGLPLHLTS